MKIAVIDGQGGGIGRHMTAALRDRLPEDVKIYGLGTNAIAILVSGSMCGEVTAKMVAAIGESDAQKILLPINRNKVTLIGVESEPVPHQIEKLVAKVAEIYEIKYGKGAKNYV